MTKEIIKKEEMQVDEQTIKDYLVGSGTKLTNEQITLFVGIAKSFNLNPFKREIYAIPYEKNVVVDGKWTKKADINIVTGYQTYIEKATSTGLLDGWNVEETDFGARITIYRKDFRMPFVWEVNRNEFMKCDKDGKPMSSWKTMPSFMIKKVVIGQGFRLAFPNELGGMPYLQEEITAEAEKEKAVVEENLLMEKQELNYSNLLDEFSDIDTTDKMENFKFKFKELLIQDRQYLSQAQFQEFLELIKEKDLFLKNEKGAI